MKLNIFNKLLLGNIAISLLILSIAIVGLNSIRELEQSTNELVEASDSYIEVQNMKLDLQSLLMTVHDYLISGDKREQLVFEQLVKQAKGRITNIAHLSSEPEKQEVAERYESRLAEFERLADAIFDLDHPVGNPAGNASMKQMDKMVNDASREFEEILKVEETQVKQSVIASRTVKAASSRNLIIAGLIITLCMILGGFYYTRAIAKPLLQLADAAQKVSEGDLTAQADINTNDEIEYLARCFNSMVGVLEKTTVSRGYLDCILNRMDDALLITNEKGQIDIVNQSLITLLGYDENELIGKHVGMIFSKNGSPDHKAELDGIMDLIRKDQCQNVYHTYYNKEGYPVPVLFTGSLIRKGDETMSAMICLASKKNHNGEGEARDADDRESLQLSMLGDIPLTKRELEVLRLIAREYKNAEIADELFISVRTVETHRKNIMQKLHTKSVISLIHYAARNEII